MRIWSSDFNTNCSNPLHLGADGDDGISPVYVSVNDDMVEHTVFELPALHGELMADRSAFKSLVSLLISALKFSLSLISVGLNSLL